MKKLLVSAVSIAALAAPAMAQEFVPAEYENSAMIEQIGTANSAIIDQTWGNLLNGQSLARVTQTGNGNSADVKQMTVSPDFTSDLNRTRLTQGSNSGGPGGDNNEAVIRQIHKYGPGARNDALVRQVTDNGNVRVRQSGSGNETTLTQRRNSVEAFARIDQNGWDNVAEVDQRSDNGRVVVNQGTFSGPNNIGSPDAMFSRVFVDSRGVNSVVRIDQFGFGNEADVYETGTDGKVDVFSDGDFNMAAVYQDGTLQTANISQVAGGATGGNFASITQAVSDEGSTAIISQEGLFSESLITQSDLNGEGGFSTATSTQTSDASNAYSLIEQDGTDHSATVTQASAYATSNVSQFGISQTANVTQ